MAEVNGGLLARFLHFCSSGMVICNNGTDIANFSNIKYMDEPISCVLRRLADEFDGAFGKNGKDDMTNVTDFRPRRVVQGWPKQGKDDMSNIRLVAGKGEPQGDKRVNVWIEQPEVMPRWPINELRIMTQVDGVGSPRCIGTIEQSNLPRAEGEPHDALIFDFPEQPMGVNTSYIVRSGKMNGVAVNVAV